MTYKKYKSLPKTLLCIGRRYCLVLVCTLSLPAFSQQYKTIHQDILSSPSLPPTPQQWIESQKEKLGNLTIVIEHEKSSARALNNWSHDSYKVYIDTIPLEYCQFKFHSKDGILQSVNGTYIDGLKAGETPHISRTEAIDIALKSFSSETAKLRETPFINLPFFQKEKMTENNSQGLLVYCPKITDSDTIACLSYKFIVNTKEGDKVVYIDAIHKNIVMMYDLLQTTRGIADTRYSGPQEIETTQINNSLYCLVDESRGNGIYTYIVTHDPDIDEPLIRPCYDNDNYWSHIEYADVYCEDAVLDAHWGAEVTYDYWQDKFSRNGIDGNGMAMINLVDLFVYADNAGWDPYYHYVTYYGGTTWTTPYTSLEIVSHEFTHGLTQSTCDLVYQGESGALNEAISDIFSMCVLNYANLGKEMWKSGYEVSLLHQPFRDYITPKNCGYADTYLGEYWFNTSSSDDEGGVHENSSVFTHWFYLLVEGGSGINDNGYSYSVDGIGFEDAEQIMYNAVTNHYESLSNFRKAADLTIESAVEIFGYCSDQVNSAIQAFRAIGIMVEDALPNNLYLDVNFVVDAAQYTAYSIVAENTISPSTTVSYLGSDEIILQPGFTAEYGCDFSARIGDLCEDGSGYASNSINSPSRNIPTENIILVDKDNSCEQSMGRYQIYDIFGRLVGTGYSDEVTKLGVSLPSGTYLLLYTNGEDFQTYKFFQK